MKCVFQVAALTLLVVGLSAGGATAAQKEQTTTEKTVSAAGIDRLKVSVEIGPIHLIAEDGSEVRIKAVRVVEGSSAEERRRWLTEPRVTIESHSDTLEVKDVIPESLRNHDSGHSNLNGSRGRDFKMHLDVDIRLPRRLIAELTTGIGNITVEGQANRVTAIAGVGTVHLMRLASGDNPVDVRTGAGHIQVDGHMGALTATDGAGNVTVAGAVRDLAIRDGAGHVDLNGLACSGKALKVDVGAGSVTIALRALPAESITVRSGTGNVKLTLPSRAAANVRLNSGMGHVTSAFALSEHGRDRGSVGQTMSGSLNGGGPALHLDVGMGNIQLASAQD